MESTASPGAAGPLTSLPPPPDRIRPPGTVTVGPPNGATNVGTNAYLRFRFSKAVDATSINPTNIAITAASNPIPGSWSYTYSGAETFTEPTSRRSIRCRLRAPSRSSPTTCSITRATPLRRPARPSPLRHCPTTPTPTVHARLRQQHNRHRHQRLVHLPLHGADGS